MSKLLDSTRPVLDPRAKVPPDLFQPTPPSEATGAAAAASGSSSRARPRPVALHGNYLNYYERRHGDPDARDERLALVPRAWTDGRSVLDVGANAGAISIELASTRDPRTVTGVDIDPDLTRKAKRNLDEAWSRLAPSRRLVDEANRLSSLTRKRRRVAASPSPVSADVVPGSASAAAADPLYFPASLGRMFGYLPPPRGLLSEHHLSTTEATRRGGRGTKRTKKVTLSSEVKRFPENVQWSTADWVHEEIDSDREGYDLILAFSVTKWIHLQSLNAGLLTFFKKCHDKLNPGGRLVLEPQPFSTYQRSVKMSTRGQGGGNPSSSLLRDNFESLKSGAQRGWRWEEGDFERVLIELVGFEKCELLGETGKVGSTFRRPVEVYTKRGGPASVEQTTAASSEA